MFLLAPLQDHYIVKQCACYLHSYASSTDVKRHYYRVGASNASSAGHLDCQTHGQPSRQIRLCSRMLVFSLDDTVAVAGRAV